MCKDCFEDGIESKFKDALEYESLSPPRFGNIELEAKDHIDALSEEFVTRFERRILEYRTPVHERIICQQQILVQDAPGKGAVAPTEVCYALSRNAIIGLRQAETEIIACEAMVLNASRDYRDRVLRACYRCNGWSCGYYGRPLEYFDQEHDSCEASTHDEPSLEGEDQVTGWDFQRCPECNTPLYLSAACNAMTCTKCRTGFW